MLVVLVLLYVCVAIHVCVMNTLQDSGLRHYHRDQRLIDIVDDEWRSEKLTTDELSGRGGTDLSETLKDIGTTAGSSSSSSSSSRNKRRNKDGWTDLGLDHIY